MRLFIGIPLPDNHQELLQELVCQLDNCLNSRVRWTGPGNGHLTLKFLGNVSENGTGELTAELSEIIFPAFDIRFGNCACYPDPNRPRVVWMAVHKGARQCEKLASVMETATTNLGFKPNTKPFKPHLTLGRVKHNGNDNWKVCLRAAKTQHWTGFRVDRFVLWKSDLTQDGPIYTPLQTFMLE